ncbi:MAG TPA: hypothetical protein VIL18_12595, partial [Longimicrobiales bacterium]
REQGFALAATILALVLVGALVTGGFFAASQEHHIGTSTQFSTEAFYYAERGLHDALGTYTSAQLQGLMPNVPDSLPAQGVLGPFPITSNGQPVGEYTLRIRRLDALLYFIESTGRVLEGGRYGGATRTLGVVARAVNMDVPADRALQIFGQISIGGTSEVDGRDTRPTAWIADCPALLDTVAGIVTRDTSLVKVTGDGEIYGEPKKVQDPTLGPENFGHFGDVTFDELAALAEKVIPEGHGPINNTAPTLTDEGACNTRDLYNWGAPFDRAHPCYNYFPIIYAEGDLHITGGTAGQGILLVEGDLEMTGGFQFFGITIIRGKLKTTGRGGHLNGVTLVQSGASLDSNWESVARGNAEVNFSSCAIQRAVNNNPWTSRLVPIGQRSWMDLSAASAG